MNLLPEHFKEEIPDGWNGEPLIIQQSILPNSNNGFAIIGANNLTCYVFFKPSWFTKDEGRHKELCYLVNKKIGCNYLDYRDTYLPDLPYWLRTGNTFSIFSIFEDAFAIKLLWCNDSQSIYKSFADLFSEFNTQGEWLVVEINQSQDEYTALSSFSDRENAIKYLSLVNNWAFPYKSICIHSSKLLELSEILKSSKTFKIVFENKQKELDMEKNNFNNNLLERLISIQRINNEQ